MIGAFTPRHLAPSSRWPFDVTVQVQPKMSLDRVMNLRARVSRAILRLPHRRLGRLAFDDELLDTANVVARSRFGERAHPLNAFQSFVFKVAGPVLGTAIAGDQFLKLFQCVVHKVVAGPDSRPRR